MEQHKVQEVSMADGFEHIQSVLSGVPSENESQTVVKSSPIPVVRIETPPLTEEYLEKDLKHDYETVRKNLRELVESGKNALDGVLAVAQEGDSPRAYEVVAQMIKTLSETNRDLLDMHNKMKGIRKTENNTTNNTTTNAIYVGSTRDLQDIINSARSSKKAFIEAQVEDAP
jgi:hypothetical protein